MRTRFLRLAAGPRRVRLPDCYAQGPRCAALSENFSQTYGIEFTHWCGPVAGDKVAPCHDIVHREEGFIASVVIGRAQVHQEGD